MSTSEKLRSKHIRTLEALADLTRHSTTLQQTIEQLQHTIDLRNACEQESSSAKEADSAKTQQLLLQLDKVEFDNQQLAKQAEQSVKAIAELKREHALALATMRKSKLALAREASEAKTQFEQLQMENESMREEYMDLRTKSQQAWELEVSNRSYVLEIEKLKAEIERLKLEEQNQRDEYVKNLKEAEKEALSSIETEKETSKDLLQKKDATWQQNVNALQTELDQERQKNLELEQSLLLSSQHCQSLEIQLKNSTATNIATPPRAPSSPKLNVDALKQQIIQLKNQIKEQQVTIERLKQQLIDQNNTNNVDTKEDKDKGFGAFIDMKRENQVLRAQIKDLMTTQARILGGNKAKRVEPGRRRRR
jgi:hypothetical protein